MYKSFKKLILLIVLISLSLSNLSYTNVLSDKAKVYGPTASDLAKKYKATYSQFTAHPDKNVFFGDSSGAIPIKSVDVKGRKKRYMSITFDSSWNNTQTYKLLDLLDKYDARATFFLTAFFIKENPKQVADILSRGHEIGNHTNTHTSFLIFDPIENKQQIEKEIVECHKVVKDMFNIDMCLFRFPYGHYSDETIAIVRDLGYFPIQWTADSSDWKNIGVDAILNIFKSANYYRPGNILLFHNGATYTVEALETILKDITDKGLRCVKVSDLIYTDNFTFGKNGRQVEKEDNNEANK